MSAPDTQLRLAVPGDEAAVIACVNDSYGLYLDRMSTPPAPMLDDYRALIDRRVVHLAENAGRLVGLIVMWPTDDHFYVDNVAVASSAQGGGIGRLLLDLARRTAMAQGHNEVRLYTNEVMTENINYYPKLGFVETHRGVESGYQRVYFSLSVDTDV